MSHHFYFKERENVSKKRVHVYMPEELQAQVHQAAKDWGISRSQVICLGLKKFFDGSAITLELSQEKDDKNDRPL